METSNQKKGLNDFSFFLLMFILGASIVTILGYLFYSIIFG
ncbi:MAG: hypothetical protein AB1521_04120 [Bacteroidota bacterium]